MATYREIHVVSQCIANTRDLVERELKNELVQRILNMVPDTDIGGSGFGKMGNKICAGDYRRVQSEASGHLGQAMDALESWIQGLTNCQRNWVAAENANMVRYRG
ncbi:hypothetical protein [Nonomuraea sp. NPDC049400]|uniref:hypothetical protein n=1 Tax=Nonomuraea sp. NPDC049400 TaxID=3364352 RepID=UPI0037A957C7